MSFVWIAICILLIALAFIGCFVQKFPGPLAAFVGILIANFGADLNISASALIICALAVVLSMVLNRFLPKITARIHEFGKAGKWGSVIGSVIGVIVLLWGGSEVDSLGAVIAFILLGLGVIPFAFCYLFELISRKKRAGSPDAGHSRLRDVPLRHAHQAGSLHLLRIRRYRIWFHRLTAVSSQLVGTRLKGHDLPPHQGTGRALCHK